MATYVLVHGAWAGGWAWGPVARKLRAVGHDVVTPTLTGQGERAHLFTPELGVDTHVRDVVAVLEYEDLADVVLVGHSYGGTVITAVVEDAASRIRHLVYLDGFVPADGQATFDFFPDEFRDGFRAATKEPGDGWRIPGGEEILDIWTITDPALRAWVGSKLTAFPLRCFEEAIRLPTGVAAGLPHTYVAGTEGPAAGLFSPFLEQGRREGWDCHELATGHACWATAPDDVARILLGV
jgi:pimeloyl-ACP methyl ester carboxylesterase